MRKFIIALYQNIGGAVTIKANSEIEARAEVIKALEADGNTIHDLPGLKIVHEEHEIVEVEVSNLLSKADEFKILQTVSGQYLCDYLPDDWEDMTEDEQDEFLSDNSWEPLEDYSTDQVWEMLDNTARAVIDKLNSGQIGGFDI